MREETRLGRREICLKAFGGTRESVDEFSVCVLLQPCPAQRANDSDGRCLFGEIPDAVN